MNTQTTERQGATQQSTNTNAASSAGTNTSSALQKQLKTATFEQGQAMLASGLNGPETDQPKPIGADIEAQLEAAIMVTLAGRDKVAKMYAVGTRDDHVGKAAALVSGLAVNSLSIAINGAEQWSVTDQKTAVGGDAAVGGWPKAYVDVLGAVFDKLADPQRSAFACAVLQTAVQIDDALALGWVPAIDFSGMTQQDVVHVLKSVATKAPALWDRLAKTAQPAHIAAIDANAWPVDKRSDLLGRIGEDEATLGVLLSTSATTVASWLTPDAIKADKKFEALANRLIFKRHPGVTRPVLEACLAAAPLRKVVAAWTLAEMQWLIDIGGRPVGPNVSATFDSKKATVWSDVGGLEKLLELRFGLNVKDAGEAFDDTNPQAKAEAFSLEGLQRIWDTLANLPGADVEVLDFADLARVSHKNEGGLFGGYGGGLMQLGYSGDSAKGKGLGLKQSDSKLLGANKALPDGQQFEHTVRHELGHAMDRTYGIMDKFQSEAEFGGWAMHGKSVGHVLAGALTGYVDEANAARATATTAAKDPKVPDGKAKADAANAKATALDVARGKESDTYKDAKASTDQVEVTSNDGKSTEKKQIIDALSERGPSAWPMVKAKAPGLAATRAGQWLEKLSGSVHYTIDSPDALGGRVYAYETGAGVNGWMSYNHSARNKKVSNFQFKSPREWFAEVYAVYYDDVKEPGKSLANVDPASKRFIDQLRSRMEKDARTFQNQGESKEGTKNLNAAREGARADGAKQP